MNFKGFLRGVYIRLQHEILYIKCDLGLKSCIKLSSVIYIYGECRKDLWDKITLYWFLNFSPEFGTDLHDILLLLRNSLEGTYTYTSPMFTSVFFIPF